MTAERTENQAEEPFKIFVCFIVYIMFILLRDNNVAQ